MSVTAKAAEKFIEVLKNDDNPENKMLRISLVRIGWCGPEFKLTLDELKGENDIVVESEGIKVIYDIKLNCYLDEAMIDYSDNWYGSIFVISGVKLSTG